MLQGKDLFPRNYRERNLMSELYDFVRYHFYGQQFTSRDAIKMTQKAHLPFKRDQVWRTLHFIAKNPNNDLIRVKKSLYSWQKLLDTEDEIC